MDKVEYVRFLSEFFINDIVKFIVVSSERFKTRGRSFKNYYFLLQKEKYFEFVVRKIFLKQIVDLVCSKGLRFVYFYGLLKIYKEKLAMRFILFVISIYNFVFARWFDDKLKFLSINSYIIFDIFFFVDEIRNLSFNEFDILVFYDVFSLFTNVLL